ncbi:MAG: hypothetical protein MK209_03220 [Planctomycetes bacterium]|nr:hypothetical protein [Planctomycetota bacterium]
MSGARAYSPFDSARFYRLLPYRVPLGRTVLVLNQTVSTQLALRTELDRLGAAGRGLLAVAEEQTSGRGRRAQDWWAGPPHANLAISLAVHHPPIPPETLGMHAACALADAARPHTRGHTLALKWPNDLLLDGAKFAGLPVETGANADAALLGLGVNLRVAPPIEVADYPTTRLDPHANREAFLARWLLALSRRLAQAGRVGPARLESDCLALLQNWAPHGVHEPRSAHRGPLVQFSVHDGLTWGVEGHFETRPLGWIEQLEPLAIPTF